MRRHLALLLLAPSLALAAPKKPDPPHVAAPPPEKRLASEKARPIDIKPVADKLDVFKDDDGNYYVSPRAGAMTSNDASSWVFFGDGKTFWQQRIIGSSEQGPHLEWYLWSPRAKGLQAADLTLDPASAVIQCRAKDDGKRKLTQLTADEAKTVLGRATFYPPRWERQSHVLLRDDDGVYYFVDELREELGGNGYRVFVGAKGALKELPMTNVASDSAGEVFATKSGSIKLVTDGNKAYWVKGAKKTELVRLDPQLNRYLIYRELGIYGQLGTVCDDQ